MHDVGKALVAIGVVIALLGLVLWKTGSLGPLGRLPGDIAVTRGSGSFYFPIVTCVVISLLLTLVSWLFRR